MSGDAGIGLDLHETRFERGFPLDAGKRDRERHVERRCRDADNFHGCKSPDDPAVRCRRRLFNTDGEIESALCKAAGRAAMIRPQISGCERRFARHIRDFMPRPLTKLEASEPLPARPAIRIQDLRKTFGQLIAVDGVSLDIAHGEFFMIVGPSGCGKTTLLRILAGLDSVTSGTIEIETPNSQRPVNSMIFQGDSIFPVDDGLGQRRLRPQDAPRALLHHQGGGGALSRPHRAHPLRQVLSAPALRRHAPARVDRARLRQRSRNPADGRAVLGARRPEQAAAAGGAAAHLGGAQEDRGVHHPLGRRGGVSRRPHHGHDGAAGKGEDVRAGAAGAAAQHHGAAEDAGIRRADRAYLVELARRGPPRAQAGERR